MRLDEAKKILKNAGYFIEFFPFKGKKKEESN